NFPGIWGLDAAVKILLGLGPSRVQDHILGLTAHAAEGLRARGWQIARPWKSNERSGLLSFYSSPVNAEDGQGRLRAGGGDGAGRDGRLRISPSYFNDCEDIERLLDALPSL